MKTKITFLMSLALAGFCAQTIRAEEVLMDTDGDGYAEVVNLDQLDEASLWPVSQPTTRLCGGADDDQLKTGTALCGGADDDQIVGGDGADFVTPFTPQGIVSDTLGLYTSSQGSYQVQAQTSQANGLLTTVQYPYTVTTPTSGVNGIYTSSQGPYQVQGQTSQTNNLYTSVQSPYTLTSDTLSFSAAASGSPQGTQANGVVASDVRGAEVTGDGGADVTSGTRISGGSLDNVTMDTMILQVMTTGRIVNSGGTNSAFANLPEELVGTSGLHGDDDFDTLWGGGGTDELIYGETGSDSLWPDNGTDSFVFRTRRY